MALAASAGALAHPIVETTIGKPVQLAHGMKRLLRSFARALKLLVAGAKYFVIAENVGQMMTVR